jgi:ubiquinone/menaquinone biosynthesis C-methylase UbiE
VQKSEYAVMYGIEDAYWWYLGLHHLIRAVIREYAAESRPLRILDAGCGTGALLQQCAALPANCAGFDLFPDALAFCRQRGLERLAQASITAIPFRTNTFQMVLSLDALCDLPTADDVEQALREIYRVLAPGGVLVFNLPAYAFLKSSHDYAVNNCQRFVKHRFQRQLQTLHFTIPQLTYRNTLLFPPLAVVRLWKKLQVAANAPGSSDLALLPRWLNTFLTKLLLAENAFLLRGGRFPFGLSLFGVARKEKIL